MPTLRLKVTLREVAPAVVRVLDVPRDVTLPELHDLLQVAIGWTDSHLHQWVAGDRRWGVPNPEWDEDDELDEATVRVRDLPGVFAYHYDFGDGWEHDVEVLGPGKEPGFVYGEGDCPPEDVGGVSGYEEFLAVMADPTHDEHEQTSTWAQGMFRPFDAERTATLVQRTLGAVPDTVRALLEVLGAQRKLTQAGRLPPAVVAEVVERIPAWRCRGSWREDNVNELWQLKEFLREVGLLRVSRGVLHRTKACQDDAEIVRRLRKGFPDGEFSTILVTSALAVLSTDGPLSDEALVERILPMIGRGWVVNGQPLDESSLKRAWWREGGLLKALDLIVKPDWKQTVAGPSALTLLPRATGLAELLGPRS